MQVLEPALQGYAWGSSTAIPEMLGRPADGSPVAEAWFGAHASAPSRLVGAGVQALDRAIASDPVSHLGDDVVSRFGPGLPFLLKLIAAARPLSLQVHPSIELAREGYEREDARAVPVDDPRRSYRDRNHKPELVYALSPFEALVGFRAPRRAAEILDGVDHPTARQLHKVVTSDPTSTGMQEAFTLLVSEATRPGPDEVHDLADAFRARLRAGSPSPRTDRAVDLLERTYPGDPGAVTAVLLNPVSLRPGEALFVPAGTVHAYLDGFAVELMANSDNVLRAGLTTKHVDVPELLRIVECVAAPPIRIAPEHVYDATDVYYVPVDDFELSVTRLSDVRCRMPGLGPRIVLCLEGRATLHTQAGEVLEIASGQAAFVPASDGALRASGEGRVIQASVP
ncbi:mannose-6-phosphate isomerase, class I [Cellulomonas xiejunii]|uniref:mannose-6-phosphate isomerase n=1 Tax=Cellulomonas xiejunii TaxID=2968083 RepID=A0ABY5KN99_9CELL|nr:mannose-6-phosphate isomerase, class I [Cellulomonas xiejunii]MCC2312896.1 mannose-6-phosphate isomerase, class I [Cellulomonas xiejunii]MCC2320234.1 mannose-6-phosphate isomerase, class I [Cellulomonas xiejunii]UUI70540.1 mannose-6-phosphate isomerase, class I [Cellulomonas xiejunii]